ncbi:hypothetical protein PHMEG_00017431 [Phytophthora megakarya]|uniref:Uncharacterized protein n=1 Tax=Phytophthora megakarya TaxID=4795 RepID=A0A225VYZ2_9STRA|nr:hypothetical protein PHMEG_00017431 [Phytophthora megakarya]
MGEAVMNLPPALGEYWIRKGTTIAAASVIPESTFGFENGTSLRTPTSQDSDGHPTVAASSAESFDETPNRDRSENPTRWALKLTLHVLICPKNRRTVQVELDRFGESSKKPDRTDHLKFEINTGNSPPFKS